MDYEKKYKEALERMKIWVSDDTPDEFFDTHEVHTFVFPELAVLEDEKVRETLIRVLNENVGNGIEKYGAKLEEALAWLEKQKKSTSMQNGIIINGVEYILIEDPEWDECERCALFEQCGNGENLICKSLFDNLSDKHRFERVNK